MKAVFISRVDAKNPHLYLAARELAAREEAELIMVWDPRDSALPYGGIVLPITVARDAIAFEAALAAAERGKVPLTVVETSETSR